MPFILGSVSILKVIMENFKHIKEQRAQYNKLFPCTHNTTSLVAQLGKNPPVMKETQVRSLGGEDPLEK